MLAQERQVIFQYILLGILFYIDNFYLGVSAAGILFPIIMTCYTSFDFIGGFLVTAGEGIERLAKNYEKDAKDKFDQNVVRKKKLLDEKLNRLENDVINQIKDNITDIVLETVKNSVKGNNIKPKVSQEIIDQGIEQIGKK